MEIRQLRWSQGDSTSRGGDQHTPTVLLAEHSSENQPWLASILVQAYPQCLLISTTGVHNLRKLLTSCKVDIAVIDLQMPGSSGIGIVQECAHSSPATRCVATTIYDDDAHLMPVLAAGALGYLLKNQPEAVLIQQLRLLAYGIPPLSPSIANRLVRHFAQQRATLASTTPKLDVDEIDARETDELHDLVRLSRREKQVLSLIAKGMQIADVGRLLDITTNTACSHIKNIYRKRNLSSRAEAALEARRLGLV